MSDVEHSEYEIGDKITEETCNIKEKNELVVVHDVTDEMGCEETSVASGQQDILLNDLLDSLAGSSAHFKSQQIGDPELTFHQKRSIADELLKRNPGQFLSRFGTNIKVSHLEYFSPMKGDYEVDFYLKKLHRFHSKKLSEVDVKNRRFEAMQKLISEGSYFSEEEMKNRNPLLYEQLIGQHLTSEERNERAKDYSKMTYVGYLMDRMDRDSRNELQQKQQDEEDGAIEELDTDDESSMDEDDGDVDRELSEKEKNVLRQEFLNSMYDSFLEGKDRDFDYSSVDFNTDYDNHKDMEQDDEEKYFDAESPESLKGENDQPDETIPEEDDELDAYMSTLSS
ncbi:coiled-coil domain-containing protein 97 [Ischnura elegans]|uniref:coiled-coil domain-containing protein 97 n=1 Tax=Ischnura elegans TaxID=197161 RepID=UPI001ED86A3C|nr:coiled-coil domain-containing protein 97 [Ischnura elegans]